VTKESLYQFFTEHPERPFHVQDLERALTADKRELRTLLSELVEEGRLVRTRRRTYGLPAEMNLVVGVFEGHSGGYAFVVPDGEEADDLYIPAGSTGGAWDGDRVVARRENGSRDRPRGVVIRILERRRRRVVGTVETGPGYALLRPDDTRLAQRVLLTPESVRGLEPGARAVAALHYPEETGEAEVFAEITEVLGSGDDPEVETRATLAKFALRGEFDPAALAEAESIPAEIDPAWLGGRADLRGEITFTIDGADAKDFDDALSLSEIGGSIVLGVHIADVSHYVTEGSALDREAGLRGTSAYLPNRVLPMLPERLSNGVCSLVPGGDRLTFSAFLELTKEGEIKGARFVPSVIRSVARFTYDEVQAFADTSRRSELGAGVPAEVAAVVQRLLDLTARMRDRRARQGALNFDFREAKVEVGPDGEIEVRTVQHNDARSLVEECMLAANRAVAERLDRAGVPALYRVHEDPAQSKVDNLTRVLGRYGYALRGGKVTPKTLQEILAASVGRPEQHVIHTILLRTLRLARYSTENAGHFGLAFADYTHFTSPIRRYPDLVVHRVLKALEASKVDEQTRSQWVTQLPKVAEHASERERAAEEAERDLTKYFQARWLQRHIGEVFTGHVTGVLSFGIFVALDNGAEGLVHVSNLSDDYYIFIEDALMLKGKHTGRSIRLGDRVKVKALAADPVARQLDFVLEAKVTEQPPEERVSRRRRRRAPEAAAVAATSRPVPQVQQPAATAPGAGPAVVRPGLRLHVVARTRRPAALVLGGPQAVEAAPAPRSTARLSRSGKATGRSPARAAARATRSEGQGAVSRPRILVGGQPGEREYERPVRVTARRLYFGEWKPGASSGELEEDEPRKRRSRSRRG
jgi:ribonuclease R